MRLFAQDPVVGSVIKSPQPGRWGGPRGDAGLLEVLRSVPEVPEALEGAVGRQARAQVPTRGPFHRAVALSTSRRSLGQQSFSSSR